MLQLLLPGAILALAGGAWASQRKRNQEKSPEDKAKHRLVYETLINNSYSSSVYREAAIQFEAMGYKAEAAMLLKRADLKDAPKELREGRRKVFDETMASFDPNYIREVASNFDLIGATGAANDLRKRADELESLIQPGDSKPVAGSEVEKDTQEAAQ